MELILIKTALNSRDKPEELKFMEKLYKDDVNISMLTVQMEIVQVRLKDGVLTKSLVRIKELPSPKNRSKQIVVNPATSAASERSFLTARRLKTWLRSRMNQERFSNLTILNIHMQRKN